MKRISLLIFLCSSLFFSYAQNKSYHVSRAIVQPKIDGDLSDETWKALPVATDYTMSDPVEGNHPTYNTEVKIVYDNTAIYIAAKMYDAHSDSIYKELGNRDEGGDLRADNIRVGFDTYNTQQDGYVFNVTA